MAHYYTLNPVAYLLHVQWYVSVHADLIDPSPLPSPWITIGLSLICGVYKIKQMNLYTKQNLYTKIYVENICTVI